MKPIDPLELMKHDIYEIKVDRPCGVYWIITTCLTGIALGLGFGGLLWLVLT